MKFALVGAPALMNGHHIGTYQIGQAGRRNSAQRGEDTPRRPKFIGPVAVMVPAKIAKFPELAPETLEPFRR
jgi:hypothetical protein